MLGLDRRRVYVKDARYPVSAWRSERKSRTLESLSNFDRRPHRGRVDDASVALCRNMSTPFAFVSLVTSDHYLPGALALAAALKDLHPTPAQSPEVGFQTVCLVTPETVDVSTIKLLRRAFDLVVGVELIEQEDEKGLRLLGELSSNPRKFPYTVARTVPCSVKFGLNW